MSKRFVMDGRHCRKDKRASEHVRQKRGERAEAAAARAHAASLLGTPLAAVLDGNVPELRM